MKREFLEHCEKSTRHHIDMGKTHARLAAAYRAVGSEEYDKVAECHDELKNHHADRAEHFIGLAKAIASEPDSVSTGGPTHADTHVRAQFARFDKTLEPSTVWGGPLPEAPRLDLKLIPRVGGPPLQKAEEIDPELRELVDGI